MTENRRFLTDDIMAMSTTARLYPLRMSEWLDTLNESELMALWNDLVEKTTIHSLDARDYEAKAGDEDSFSNLD